MKVTVLPVSGGAFPTQIASLLELNLANNPPELILGSSGGNVAAYLCLAADWSPYGVERLLGNVNSELFLQSWWPHGLRFIPSWMLGYFYGSFYQQGKGSEELFKNIFTPSTIRQIEIWTGTINRNESKAQFFCNKSEHDSIIKNCNFNPKFRGCLPLIYLNGDIESLAKVSIASVSIPTLVPEQVINGNSYADGGTFFASPLTGLQDQIGRQKELHIDYLSSFDIQGDAPPRFCNNLIQNGTFTLHEIIRSICIQDRSVALDLLKFNSCQHEIVYFSEGDCSAGVIQYISEQRTKHRRSLLELYPKDNDAIDLTNFTSVDIVNLIKKTRANYRYRFWFLSKAEENFSTKDIFVSDKWYLQ